MIYGLYTLYIFLLQFLDIYDKFLACAFCVIWQIGQKTFRLRLLRYSVWYYFHLWNILRMFKLFSRWRLGCMGLDIFISYTAICTYFSDFIKAFGFSSEFTDWQKYHLDFKYFLWNKNYKNCVNKEDENKKKR